jgi:hypothetical protein
MRLVAKGCIQLWINVLRSIQRSPNNGCIGLMAIMKNERSALREWIEHHHRQGFSKIFLIDNGSTDSPLDILQPYLDVGIVEYFWRPRSHFQVGHYREVYRSAKVRQKVEWLAMADLDEFWFTPSGTVRDLLQGEVQQQWDCDLIYANWIVFGSSGRKEQPASIREGFVHRHERLGPHVCTKWICRTQALVLPSQIWVHKVFGIDSRKIAWENIKLRMHHYPIQSEEFFRSVKMSRGDVIYSSLDGVRTFDYFLEYDRDAVVLDTTLADLVAQQRGQDK